MTKAFLYNIRGIEGGRKVIKGRENWAQKHKLITDTQDEQCKVLMARKGLKSFSELIDHWLLYEDTKTVFKTEDRDKIISKVSDSYDSKEMEQG